jgi:hypothetical protein
MQDARNLCGLPNGDQCECKAHGDDHCGIHGSSCLTLIAVHTALRAQPRGFNIFLSA